MQQKLLQNRATARAELRSAARQWEWLAIVAIALAAFAIRAWTARLNLPYVDHPDEPNPINYVVGMLRTGDPNPHFFQKPSLYVYLLLAVLSLHYRWGLAHGVYGPIDQMAITTHLYTTIPGFFFWGRMLTAALGALTVAYLFLLGRRVWSRAAGLLAALFLAVSPFHMRHSQYVTTDVATGWLVLLALGACIAVARGGRWRDYLAAGALVGLAASTKYNAGVAALMVCAAHLLSARRQWLSRAPRLFASGAAAVLGFVAGTPYAALSFGEFRQGLLGQVKDYGEISHGDFTGAWNVRGYFGFFWSDGLGAIACVATAIGLALLLWPGRQAVLRVLSRQKGVQDAVIRTGASSPGFGALPKPATAEHAASARAAGLLWLSFVTPYLLLHMAQASHFNRNMVAVVVLCALPIGVAGAAAIVALQGWILRLPSLAGLERSQWASHPASQSSRTRTIAAYAVAAAVCLVLLVPAALETWTYSLRLHRGDTRVQALAWIDARVPPGVRVAAELRPLPGAPESRWAEAPSLLAHDLAWYRRQGFGYLVASSDTWKQWTIPPEYATLAGAPVAEFGGGDPRDMLGPHLAIYATGLSAADAPTQLSDMRVGGARLAGIALGRPVAKTPGLGLEPAATLKPGETLALRTFWSVEQPFGGDFFIFVHLVDAAGNTLAQRDAPPWLGRFPTSAWQPGSVVVDVDDLPLPKDLPPGTYTIAIGMFDPATGGHPPMTRGGQPVGAIEAGQVTVKR